ncbi:preprotein translocase subunit SecA [Derxia gummosa]|uniref:Protein translocase subunit SecA n=1 Tax=Derxia gummosa DSM 723 TaxID=1121388 RepID=A0A8B6X796_9BURK|nr:preprotein translocase subunit SecA [Derxia gummosa]
MLGLVKKIFGSRNDRLLKQYRRTVAQINALEASIQPLSDDQLKAKTVEFRDRLAKGATLDDLLPEAFAVVREAGKRVMGMRHFDVQLIGGMVLHYGKIAEMRTGEGKTLTATLPVYLNALSGRGVHVITVNDYLAQRDAEWMSRLYGFLGLTTGINLSQMPHAQKQAAYAADITYGTNNEFGFDYLRDNMVYGLQDRVQRSLVYAIVDEVDSILIDEARTPLIISGPAEDHTDVYVKMNAVPPLMQRMEDEPKPDEPDSPGDFWIDEKAHRITLSEAGFAKAEETLSRMGLLPEGASLYDPANIALMHHLMAALRAHYLFHRDQHYVVRNGEVTIVDEFTGRMMVGRRWSDGLHQAVEAKEGVKIQAENHTMASITFQNYFRMYEKLAGMTGTADTEAYEFQEIYALETVVIPTNRPPQRKDMNDQVFRSAREKHNAIVADIKECHGRGQPVLVGTTSIENSEVLSQLLTEAGLPHEVLNAKQHEREALIVAQAGKPGAVTIATNMAGRGTDIVLGGNVDKQIELVVNAADVSDDQKQAMAQTLRDEWQAQHDLVLREGGLKIIGTERHESRRVDNQLRGRAGRQGDPGASRFYLSLDDPLLRIFAGDRVRAVMDRLNMPDGEAIEAGIVTRSIEGAQRKVEARNFDIRKQLLEYDDVSNDQRKVVYQQRNEILAEADVGDMVTNLRHGVVTDIFRAHVPEESVEEQWDLKAAEAAFRDDLHIDVPLAQWLEADDKLSDDDLLQRVLAAADDAYSAKVALAGREAFNGFERSVMLQALDTAWREHLAALDYLREGIHLRSYAQKNPKQEYKREAFELFGQMLDKVKLEVTRMLMAVRVQTQEQIAEAEAQIDRAGEAVLERAQGRHAEFDDLGEVAAGDAGAAVAVASAATAVATGELPKVGRNDPCPCGSGKKYKQCHGRIE